MTRRVAGVDCGTNSIRLLVADVEGGSLSEVVRRMEVVRLGYGVDRTGVIDSAAMRRTLDMCRTYADQCAELGVQAVRFVATSASRDARNAGEFIDGVAVAFSQWGARPEVITGQEEAELSFRGATGDLVPAGVPGPYLVVDLGGGSTELVRGTDQVQAAISVDIGCVRMTERHLHADPPTPAQVGAALRDIDAALDRAAAAVDLAPVRTLVGLAGTVTTVTAHALGLTRYDAARIHLATLAPDQVMAACDDLLARTAAERLELPFMHPGRADVIGAGALVWGRIVERVRREAGLEQVVTSEHDILDGITLSAAAPQV